jgi:hypothetical protein
MERKAYPSDVSDEEWALVAPYLTLMTEDAPQRDYPLREVFNGRRLARDYERLPQILEGLHILAFAILMLKRFADIMFQS